MQVFTKTVLCVLLLNSHQVFFRSIGISKPSKICQVVFVWKYTKTSKSIGGPALDQSDLFPYMKMDLPLFHAASPAPRIFERLLIKQIYSCFGSEGIETECMPTKFCETTLLIFILYFCVSLYCFHQFKTL